MALKKRTWIWIVASVLGAGVLCVVAVAGFGFYFISHNVKATHATSADAFRAFDEAQVRFKDAMPLFELDRREEPKMTRRLEDLPAGATRAETMYILAWDPEKERLARVTMPFWMLRLGHRKVDLTSGGFEFQRLQLDIEQLERVGPILLFDYRPQTGQRVLVWTQ
jgi:hypothetical protein